jgi:hypothetical protein
MARSTRMVPVRSLAAGAIARVETDADGHAAYEAHMVEADGTPVTVYVPDAGPPPRVRPRAAGRRLRTGGGR